MKFTIILLAITSSINIACGQYKYEWEFLEERLFSACENHPDNILDNLLDMSNANVAQNEDGSLVVNGFCIIATTVEEPLPLSIEVFKKERGTWQPTIYTQKRDDTCKAWFGKTEVWHSYLKNTPEEQLKCPLIEGQRIDFDINEPTYMSLPIRISEGEYKVHVEIGSASAGLFICVDIFGMLHKM